MIHRKHYLNFDGIEYYQHEPTSTQPGIGYAGDYIVDRNLWVINYLSPWLLLPNNKCIYLAVTKFIIWNNIFVGVMDTGDVTILSRHNFSNVYNYNVVPIGHVQYVYATDAIGYQILFIS